MSTAENIDRSAVRVLSSRGEAEGDAGALPVYLREMGEFDLLTKTQEGELSRRFQEARAALAALASRLPTDIRKHVLAGVTQSPRLGRRWPVIDAERFHDRLVAYAREHGESRVRGPLREVRRARARMEKARDALILSNLRLVVHVAKKFLNNGVSFMDLIQEGNLGLMRAVEKFEYQRGHRFSTYAYWWIKQSITRAIADKSRTIRIPVHVGEKLRKIAAARADLRETLGRPPLPREIARKLRMPVAKVEEILEAAHDVRSFEELGTRSDEGPGILQFLADPESASPHDTVVEDELRHKVEGSLRVLDAREEKVIRLRFGIGHDAPRTLEEIGNEISLSRERVRQIEGHALRKILATDEARDLARH